MKINWKQVAMFAAAGALFVVLGNLLLKPDTIDWVNVALVPELAEELQADLATRLQLAHIGYLTLDGIKGPPDTPTPAGKEAETYGRAVLERHGQQVFDLLTVPQRKQFYYLFRERKVLPVAYRTEPPPGGSGPAVYWLEFGWKQASRSMHDTLEETAALLALSWQFIPNKLVAESLVDHHTTAVSTAAENWLLAHEPPKQEKKRALTGPYAEDKWARHDRKIAEARRRLDRTFADRGDTGSESRPSYEERVATMKQEHEKRVAEMRQRHEERVREMREKQRDDD